MKKFHKVFFTFLFVLTNTVFAQQTDSMKIVKWQIGFVLSPNYTYRIFHTNSQQTIRPINSNGFYTAEDQIPKFGWHTGILFSYQVFHWCSMQTGFLMDKKGFNTNNLYMQTYGTYQPYRNYYNYTDFGIPFFINGKVHLHKKISIAIVGGFTANFFTYEKATIYYLQKQNFEFHFKAKEIEVNLFGKVGIIYKTANSTSIAILPICSYNVNNYNTTSILNNADDSSFRRINLYSLGLEIAMDFGLSKKK